MDIERFKRKLRNMVDDPWEYGDPDHAKCPHCKQTLSFYGHDDNGDFPLGEGYWECHSCGFKIYEKEF